MKIQSSKTGIEYLERILRDGPRTITRALIWRIEHRSGKQGLSLKLARYNKDPEDFNFETLENKAPKSELTLTEEELENLVSFLSENYGALREGLKSYIPIENESEQLVLLKLKTLLANPDKQRLIELITENKIVPEDILVGLEIKKRRNAISEFEQMLERDLVESQWQKWFQRNEWVLGTEFVRILDERAIDTSNISDFLMQAYDGFLDVVEIKRPGGSLDFWAKNTDHGNYYPSTDLTKAIAQSNAYIYEFLAGWS